MNKQALYFLILIVAFAFITVSCDTQLDNSEPAKTSEEVDSTEIKREEK